MKSFFTENIRSITFLFVFSLILFSCTSAIRTTTALNYDESINRQFWTADWSSDNKFIAIGGVDSIVRIYNDNSLKLYKSFHVNSWIHVIKWSPDNKTLAVATLDKDIQLVNLETGIKTSLNSNGGSRSLDWNFDGKLLAVGDLDGVIKIWNKNGKLISTFEKKYGPETVGRSYLAVDWHPFKNIFVAVNFEVHFFDSAAREFKSMEHPNKAALMLCVSWHPSGDFFVIGDYGHKWEGENIPSLLHFWSEDGKLIKSVPGSKGEYRNISWNKEGTRLATASDVLRIWSGSGTLLHESKPDSTNFLWGIDWSDKSDKIVTASRYKTIALWDSTATLLKRIDVRKKSD